MSLFYSPGFRMICVDPGLRGCGVAEFVEGNLTRAAYVKNPRAEGRGYAAHASMAGAIYNWVGKPVVDKFIIEHPRIYPGSAQQKGDLNDLLDVVGVGSAIAASFPEYTVDSVFPSDWKGQVPKDVMTARISKAILQNERACIEKCPASLMHNLLDAVGIGLWKLSRINQRTVHHE
jgi:hypothetical protein